MIRQQPGNRNGQSNHDQHHIPILTVKPVPDIIHILDIFAKGKIISGSALLHLGKRLKVMALLSIAKPPHGPVSTDIFRHQRAVIHAVFVDQLPVLIIEGDPVLLTPDTVLNGLHHLRHRIVLDGISFRQRLHRR